jgi:ribosomal protein L37AE/L43A
MKIETAKVIQDLLDHIDINTCLHEETHRGGNIWTICDMCGKKWADDMGGFKPYVEPKYIAAARELLYKKGY